MMTHRDRIDETSPDMKAELLARLRALVPEAFSDGQLDLERLGELAGDVVATGPERYGLTWPGKRDAIAMLQAPSRATLVPEPGQSVNFDDAQHVFIEGENLEVLKLLYKSYFGRVKLIYIDPPYNTGNDFIYNDDFSDPLAAYLKQTGQMTEDGDMTTSAPEKTGRFHSNWLSMMYPRLSMARQMLADDGVICVSIDDDETTNLRGLLNEVFGEENFVATVVWQKRYVSNVTAKYLSDMHDFVHVYARDKTQITVNEWPRTDKQLEAYKNPDNDPRGNWRAQDLSASKPYKAGLFTIKGPTGETFDPPPNRYWRCNEKTFEEWRADKRIWWGKKFDARPMLKAFIEESEREIRPHTWWDYDFAGHNKEATLELKEIFDGDAPFDTPKPVRLITRILETFGSKDGLYVDFFAGSGVLGNAVFEMNAADNGTRSCISVQFPEPTSRPDHPTIAAIAKDRFQRVLKTMPESNQGFRAFRLTTTNIRRWAGTKDMTPEGYIAQMEAFADTLLPGWKPEDVIWEVALREGFPLTSKIAPAGNSAPKGSWRVTDPETDRAFAICLADHIDLEQAKRLGLTKPDLFVCRDTALDDTVAANLALQCTLKVL